MFTHNTCFIYIFAHTTCFQNNEHNISKKFIYHVYSETGYVTSYKCVCVIYIFECPLNNDICCSCVYKNKYMFAHTTCFQNSVHNINKRVTNNVCSETRHVPFYYCVCDVCYALSNNILTFIQKRCLLFVCLQKQIHIAHTTCFQNNLHDINKNIIYNVYSETGYVTFYKCVCDMCDVLSTIYKHSLRDDMWCFCVLQNK